MDRSIGIAAGEQIEGTGTLSARLIEIGGDIHSDGRVYLSVNNLMGRVS